MTGTAPNRSREARARKTRAWLRRLLRDWRKGRRSADDCMAMIGRRLDQAGGDT